MTNLTVEVQEAFIVDLLTLFPESDPAVDQAIDETRNSVPRPADILTAINSRALITWRGIDPHGAHAPGSEEGTLSLNYLRLVRSVRENRTC